jgi:hypothetical protein
MTKWRLHTTPLCFGHFVVVAAKYFIKKWGLIAPVQRIRDD